MRSPERKDPIFFYADNCPRCAPELRKVIPILDRENKRLIIRKPSLIETSTPGFAYPALLIPAGFLNVSDTVLMVGSGIADALEHLILQIKKIEVVESKLAE